MKIIWWAVIILIVALVVKSEYPSIYEQSFQRGIDYGMEQWNERKNDFTAHENHNGVTGEGEISSPKSGTNYGQPWDEANFPCTSTPQCQARFSVTSVCKIETGECIEP